MFRFHLKIVVVIFMVLQLAAVPVLGVHGFMIKCSDDALSEEMQAVKLSKATPTPTSQWSRNIDTFFCQDLPGKSKYYQITIDLEGFSSGSLSNISKFLTDLAAATSVNLYTPLLILTNGTSFKFNRIFKGIKAFFQKVPRAQVHYYHSGIQSPCAAEKGLSLLASVQSVVNHATSGGAMDKLALEIVSYKLPDGEGKPLSPNFSEICDGSSPGNIKTNFPTEMLQKMVQFEEVEEKMMALRSRWDSQEGGEWPPLGIKDLNQVKQIHIDSLGKFLKDGYLDATLVLEVSGLLGGDDIRKVVDLCWKMPSLRCLRIRDSACMLSSFVEFCDPQSTDEDIESAESMLLDRNKLRFLDVQTALRGGADSTEKSEYSGRRKKFFIDHFVWIPAEDNRFESLSIEAKKTHLLFEVLSGYLALLQSEFGNSSDRETQ